MNGDTLEKYYKEGLEERIIAHLAKVKNLTLEQAMDIYYSSQLAQKIFEGRIVGASPFLIVLMIRLTAPDYIKPMTESTQGLIITTIAVGLMAVSLLMTERINKIEI